MIGEAGIRYMTIKLAVIMGKSGKLNVSFGVLSVHNKKNKVRIRPLKLLSTFFYPLFFSSDEKGTSLKWLKFNCMKQKKAKYIQALNLHDSKPGKKNADCMLKRDTFVPQQDIEMRNGNYYLFSNFVEKSLKCDMLKNDGIRSQNEKT